MAWQDLMPYTVGAFVMFGRLIDRYPLKWIYLPIAGSQVVLFALASQATGWPLYAAMLAFMVFVFGAIPFIDAMIVRYVDDRLRSRVSGMRLAVSFGVSSLAVYLLGPTVKSAGFTTLLVVMALISASTTLCHRLLVFGVPGGGATPGAIGRGAASPGPSGGARPRRYLTSPSSPQAPSVEPGPPHRHLPPLRISGDADRYDHRAGNDDYTQAGNLFRLLPADGKARLFANIAETMRDVPDFIVKRQLEHFTKADPAYGKGVAQALQHVS